MATMKFLAVLLFIGAVQADFSAKYVEPAVPEDIRRASGSRIVAGWEATEGQIPYQVSLRNVSPIGRISACGGSLIHHHWIITAAHCLANRESFVIRLGMLNVTQPGIMFDTTLKHIHPDYIEVQGGVQTDDIALLGVDWFIPYGPNVQPCRLQNSQQKDLDYLGVVFTVSGFGITNDLWLGGIPSEALLWTHLRGITNEECRQWYNNSTVIQGQTLCAEYYNVTAQSACQGDSGGPLTKVDVDGRPTMVGIVSFGAAAGCNSPFPSAYVRPGYYHDWFLAVTGINFDWSEEDIRPPTPEGSNVIAVDA